MRVLHTIHDLATDKGGPSRSVPQLAEALAAQGMTVGLWAQLDSPLATRRTGYASFYGNLRRAIGEFRPDIVHDHGVWMYTNHHTAVLCRSLKIPRVISPHGSLMPWGLKQKKFKKQLAWLIYQKRDFLSAAALHATAAPEADYLRALGFPKDIFIAANGVDVPRESTRGVSIDERRTALFIGRLHPAKGLPQLVEAWAAVRPTGWVMRVVGPDQDGYRSKLEQLVQKHGLTDDWTFEGEVLGDDKWLTYHQAQLFILPSHTENFGIVAAEALACGVPVLTTTGTPWEGLLEKGGGWYVSPDVRSLTSALADATSSPPERLQTMGAAGKKWVQATFSWHAVAEQVCSGYRRILS